MFQIRKRQISISDMVAEAEESLRLALEVHHEVRIRMGRREVDPGKKRNEADDYRYVTVEVYCVVNGKDERVFAEIDMMKRNGNWAPDRIHMSIGDEFGSTWHHARWEDRGNAERDVLVAPDFDNYDPANPFFKCGDHAGNRWTEPFYPKK